jgi:hypothetical protein
VAISKRLLAKEWLIFLAMFPLGFPACLFLGYYWENFRNDYFPTSYLYAHSLTGDTAFDAFWNDGFGLGNGWSLALWFTPYLAVTILRSVYWSIKTLRGKEAKV